MTRKELERKRRFVNMKERFSPMATTRIRVLLVPAVLLFWGVFLCPGLSLTGEEIQNLQSMLDGKSKGEKIAFWAEQFLGVPYDKDPRGEYVTRAVIVADERVDCIYLTFRAVELALSRTPEEAVEIALDKRFHSRGILKDGRVTNYEDRFEYGEDMIRSGKWGREITSSLGRTIQIPGSRGQDFFQVLPPGEISRRTGKLRSGDILFFMKSPEKRVVGEGVGHIGIVKAEGTGAQKKFYLIHAGGTKTAGGAVRKASLSEYLSKMAFVGVKVARFE
jgi:hypothetical protein